MAQSYDYVHTGPGTIAGAYMRKFWHPCAIDTLKPGTTKPLRHLGEDLTLYKGQSGKVYLVDFRCAHRRAQLSVGEVEGETLRCRYHGWRYDGTGQCVEQPAEGSTQFAQRVKIAGYPVRVYKGLVFAYLGTGAPPEFMTFPTLETDGLSDNYTYVRDCNFFNNMDNNLDEAHLPFVHREAFNRIPQIPEIEARETEYGGASYCTRGNAVRVTHFLMPNILMFKTPIPDPDIHWGEVVLWRVPVDDEHHATFGINCVQATGAARERYMKKLDAARDVSPPDVAAIAARVLRGEMTLDEATASLDPRQEPYKVYLEDSVIQAAQGVIVDRTGETLGKSDVGVTMIRRLWQTELALVAADRPTRSWAGPAALETTSGE